MAHHKKKPTEQQPDKMDQLINIVTWLANEVKNMKQELAEVKSWTTTQAPEVIQPWDNAMDELEYNKKFKWGISWAVTVQRETPYKVIPIESIVRDMSYLDPKYQGIKKIYRWIGKTFPNKKLATEYLERAQRMNPWTQYDIFPV